VSEEKETLTVQYIVSLARDMEVVPAENYSIDMSGALVFTNGNLLNRELVVAYAPGEWLKVMPLDVEDDDDEDDEA
jgi:hypothetical protein